MKGDQGIAGLPGERVSVTILNLVTSFLSELLGTIKQALQRCFWHHVLCFTGGDWKAWRPWQ